MSAFSKKNKTAVDLQAISTLISEGAVLTGNLKAPSVARVDGSVEGDITVDEGLILGEKGFIKGDVTTKEMVVYGAITGNLTVHSLQIKSTGKVNGNITTSLLSVETGAIYNGNLLMNKQV
jgi:cytoskeletal protein CcmA (bactofilin family)